MRFYCANKKDNERKTQRKKFYKVEDCPMTYLEKLAKKYFKMCEKYPDQVESSFLNWLDSIIDVVSEKKFKEILDNFDKYFF